MNGVVKTLILLVVFVVSAIIGFILPVQGLVAKIDEMLATNIETPSEEVVVVTTQTPEVASAPEATPATEVTSVPEQMEDSLTTVIKKPEIEPVEQVDFEVSSVTVYGLRKNDDTDKLHYSCSIKALYPEGTRVKYCAYYYQNGEEKSISSTNSTLRGLPPVDGGVYEFTIKNMNTGEESPRFAKKGFDKVRKMSRAKLESILNSATSLPNDFYHYIVKDVKINAQSQVEGYKAPDSCENIINDVKFSSCEVKVVGEPKYNEDNRITEFTVVVTQK